MLIDNTLNTALMTAERPVSSRTRVWFVPLLATLTLHAGAAGLIYLGWQPQPPTATPEARSIKTQLVVMPAPAVQREPAPIKPTAKPEPVVQPPPAAVAPTPSSPVRPPEPIAKPPDAAAIARKQAEQHRQRELARQQEAAASARRAAETQARLQHQAAEREAARQRAADTAAAAKAADVSSYAPLTKVAPDYPRRALSRHLEGDCTVEYTVLADGRVSDPQVVPGACEEQIFVRPSLAAAKDFVYQPRMINGQSVAVPGVRNTFRYRLETVSRP